MIRTRDGDMWFGTNGGVSRLFASETGEPRWTTYTFDDGPNNVGWQGLCEARDGSIWVGFFGTDSTHTGAIRRFVGGN